MSQDFNAELHARPSIYFAGPAFVEHLAFMSRDQYDPIIGRLKTDADAPYVRTQIERHTEFVTVTRVVQLDADAREWPVAATSSLGIGEVSEADLICRIGLLVNGTVSAELGPSLRELGFQETAASSIGGGAALVCSDFRVRRGEGSRIALFNSDLNAYRLGRMVRRILEIETYRSIALMGLPEARRLAPLLSEFDARLIELSDRNLTIPTSEHKPLLDEISALSARVISATAETRNRFGATAAYAQIVEERIAELRETHVPGFQRFGVFVARRFKPAVRTCAATVLRLDQLSRAATHLVDLLQTRIQMEIELQNTIQIQAMADRAATQVKIQRAVEGFSVIAISYYLLSLLKVVFETVDHAGYHISPLVMLVSIPIVIATVGLTVLRVKHALEHD
ncbi:hypothetical protein ASE04_23780 [Rhizobium sp. Root708]|uniref:DUF3422 domain-containing protein n=1 Tax=Rhizobium sp. Root708 TaxID=1736592 RepID=UPI0006F44E68|nr:DUF3422 domain-containing protein [Rhizobium sp. Root708]KRB60633.1 hypothetical protein ASE04_23780 [Rhizobium sp. Root708]